MLLARKKERKKEIFFTKHLGKKAQEGFEHSNTV